MTSPITINYSNATFTASSAAISVSGGTFQLTNINSLSLRGSFTFNALDLSSGMLSFSVATGTSVNGTVTIPVSAANPGSQPTITASNFTGMAMISWPSTTGPQFQPLSSGDPITLTNFAG